MFSVIEERHRPLEAIDDARLRRLLAYWEEKRGTRPMPARPDINPIDLKEHLGHLHLLEVLGPGLFRFRVYGSEVSNPDVRDMTGRTSRDYEDRTFADLVTRHYQACVDVRRPLYHHVLGKLDGHPYESVRLSLPLSGDGTLVDMLLTSPVHRCVPVGPLSRGPRGPGRWL